MLIVSYLEKSRVDRTTNSVADFSHGQFNVFDCDILSFSVLLTGSIRLRNFPHHSCN